MKEQDLFFIQRDGTAADSLYIGGFRTGVKQISARDAVYALEILEALADEDRL